MSVDRKLNPWEISPHARKEVARVLDGFAASLKSRRDDNLRMREQGEVWDDLAAEIRGYAADVEGFATTESEKAL
jgi:hypothetical protein